MTRLEKIERYGLPFLTIFEELLVAQVRAVLQVVYAFVPLTLVSTSILVLLALILEVGANTPRISTALQLTCVLLRLTSAFTFEDAFHFHLPVFCFRLLDVVDRFAFVFPILQVGSIHQVFSTLLVFTFVSFLFLVDVVALQVIFVVLVLP